MDRIPDCVDLDMLMAPVTFKNGSEGGIWFVTERVGGRPARVKLISMDGMRQLFVPVSEIQSLQYRDLVQRYSRFHPSLAVSNIVLNEVEREKSRLRRLRTRVLRESRTGYRHKESDRERAKKWNNSTAG